MLYCMVYFLQKKDTNAAKGQHIIETKHPKSAHNISEKNPTSPKPPSPPVKSEATAKRIGIAGKTIVKGTTSTLVIRFKKENSNYYTSYPRLILLLLMMKKNQNKSARPKVISPTAQ